MAVEIVHGIPLSALKVYTDGSMGDDGISARGLMSNAHSHIGLNGNQIVDSLAKSANADTLLAQFYITFAIKRIKLNALWRITPDHPCCQVIYSQFGLAIHPNDHQARRRFVEWAPNEMAVVPDFHMRILFSDEAHFWLNGYVNKQNGRIWSEANPQVYVETPLHPEKLTVWCALWAGGILLQKR
ncbi:hypothetical protein TNCV_199641 [Trichonephila clavipes]|nr:hypothetical protein TNCV_199641 [Trichonephila clavipes]